VDVGGRPLEGEKMVYHPLVTRVVPNTIMRRERMLPVRGEVLVGTGSRVEPSDIVASAMLPSEVHLLNVAKVLSVNHEDLDRYLQVSVGDLVAEGDILAGGRGPSRLFRRTYYSPTKGMVAAISNGRLLIQSGRTTLELEAHYRGTVINAMSGLGAIIEIRGALIQGVWGSGKEGFGVLRLAVSDPAQSIEPKTIDISCRGTVLVGGSSIDEEALYLAQEMQVEGIVVGGLGAGLRELASSMPFPVIVTGGMGRFAISRPIFDLLQAFEGQEASIRGAMEARGGTVRPEIIIYTPQAAGEPVVESRPEFVVSEGSQVRIVRGPHAGETGKVVGFPSSMKKVETGASFRGIEVRLESGEEVFVPQANLELFG
jgi:hypothetical protein